MTVVSRLYSDRHHKHWWMYLAEKERTNSRARTHTHTHSHNIFSSIHTINGHCSCTCGSRGHSRHRLRDCKRWREWEDEEEEGEERKKKKERKERKKERKQKKKNNGISFIFRTGSPSGQICCKWRIKGLVNKREKNYFTQWTNSFKLVHCCRKKNRVEGEFFFGAFIFKY